MTHRVRLISEPDMIMPEAEETTTLTTFNPESTATSKAKKKKEKPKHNKTINNSILTSISFFLFLIILI